MMTEFLLWGSLILAIDQYQSKTQRYQDQQPPAQRAQGWDWHFLIRHFKGSNFTIFHD